MMTYSSAVQTHEEWKRSTASWVAAKSHCSITSWLQASSKRKPLSVLLKVGMAPVNPVQTGSWFHWLAGLGKSLIIWVLTKQWSTLFNATGRAPNTLSSLVLVGSNYRSLLRKLDHRDVSISIWGVFLKLLYRKINLWDNYEYVFKNWF